MNDSDDRNGGRPSLHPEVGDDPELDFGNMDPRATATLAAHLARRQELADDDLCELESAVARIELGQTEWQRHMKSGMQQLHDQVQLLTLSRFLWPTFTTGALIVLGSCLATVLWKLVH